jgi:arsenate reductase
MKKRVLILCTGNSARSQMAEGLLAHDGADRFEVESAGTKPGRVKPEAIAVMKELGIDISDHRSKHVEEFQGQRFDYVLTVCDNARERCPLFPGNAKRLHRTFDDPATCEGSEEERLAVFRRVRTKFATIWSKLSATETAETASSLAPARRSTRRSAA